MRGFLYDFCMEPANSDMSRNYLQGFGERLAIDLAYPDFSSLVQACLAVSYGSHARPLNRPRMICQAEDHYQKAFKIFAQSLRTLSSGPSKTARITALLLGLYEIVKADEHVPNGHRTHADGLVSLFGQDDAISVLLHYRLFDCPALSTPGPGLSRLLLRAQSLWHRSSPIFLGSSANSSPKRSLPESEMQCLMDECLLLDSDLKYWDESRPSALRPVPLGHKGSANHPRQEGFWPGPVESYLDLYTAGVWNIYRMTRLLLVTLVMEFSDRLGNNARSSEWLLLGQSLANNVASSVPYHLIDDLAACMVESYEGHPNDRGRTLGGLLLMHPLYVVKHIPYIDQKLRHYMHVHLERIATNLGIGHAALLAKVILQALASYRTLH